MLELQLDQLAWLCSPEGARGLALAADITTEASQLSTLASRLRAQFTAEQTHLLLQQWELRTRATEKFPRAAEMLLAGTLLEQATDSALAAFKASRFSPGKSVADLCCGLGGDLFALAAQGTACGVDLSPLAAKLAEENCRRLGLRATVVQADAGTFPVQDYDAWHIDPDRRAAGKRTWDPLESTCRHASLSIL